MKSFALKLLPCLACTSLLVVLATDDACARSRRARRACRGAHFSSACIAGNQQTTGVHAASATAIMQPVCPPEAIAHLYEQTESIAARDIPLRQSRESLRLIVTSILSRFEVALEARLANAAQAGDSAGAWAAREEYLQHLRRVQSHFGNHHESARSPDAADITELFDCAIALQDSNQDKTSSFGAAQRLMERLSHDVEMNEWQHRETFDLVYTLRLAARTRIQLGEQSSICHLIVLHDVARTLHYMHERDSRRPIASVLRSEYLHAVAWHAEAEIALVQGDQAAALAAVRRALQSTRMVEAAEAEWETLTATFGTLVECIELRAHLLALAIQLEQRDGLAEHLQLRAARYRELVPRVRRYCELTLGDDGRDFPLSRCWAGLAEFQSWQYCQNAACWSP